MNHTIAILVGVMVCVMSSYSDDTAYKQSTICAKALNKFKKKCTELDADHVSNLRQRASQQSEQGWTKGAMLKDARKFSKEKGLDKEFNHCLVAIVNLELTKKTERKEAEKKKAESDREKNISDFRKIRWGMTINQVKSLEDGILFKEVESTSGGGLANGQLIYISEIHGVSALIGYTFKTGIVTGAMLKFPDALENADEVAQAIIKIREQATKEFGLPIKKTVESDVIYTVWQTNRTRASIMMPITLINMDVIVLYASVKYQFLPDIE